MIGKVSVKWMQGNPSEPSLYLLLKELRNNSITLGLLQILHNEFPDGLSITEVANRSQEKTLLSEIGFTPSVVARTASRLWRWGFLEKSTIDSEPHYRLGEQNLNATIDVMNYHLLVRAEAGKTTEAITRFLKHLKTPQGLCALEREAGFPRNNEGLSQ